jgi:PBP1b-binding outer membrane lipoprotein LpoB
MEGKMKYIVFLSILIIILSGCAKPSEEIIQTAIAQTEEAKATVIPKFTVSPTNTLSPTMTLTPTITMTPTITLTPTVTMKPAQITATVIQATQEYQAEMRLLTATAVQATKEYQSAMKMATATSVQATNDYKASFKTIAWKELSTYPDNHSGEKIKIRGRVFQIIQASAMMLWYPGTYDAFNVVFNKEFSGIYEDQTLTIYGTVVGEYCYDTRAGGSNCVPQIIGEWFTK